MTQQRIKTHKRNTFTTDEDERLKYLVYTYGENNWPVVMALMPSRNTRQCRERWFKYLSPAVNKQEWSEEEDQLLIQKIKELGPKWKYISQFFNGRTDINLKSRYRVLKRKMNLMGSFFNNKNFTLPSELKTPKEKQQIPKLIDDSNYFDFEFEQFDDIYQFDY